MIRRIGGGSYGEVWPAHNVMGGYHAVKIVSRATLPVPLFTPEKSGKPAKLVKAEGV